jgi:hypothetical protein
LTLITSHTRPVEFLKSPQTAANLIVLKTAHPIHPKQRAYRVEKMHFFAGKTQIKLLLFNEFVYSSQL